LPVWARIVGGMLDGFPPTPFASDADLDWEDIDPWSGLLADSTGAVERVPFLPGTAPLAMCDPGFDDVDASYDSLGVGDSVWTEPDTLDVSEPDSLEGREPD